MTRGSRIRQTHLVRWIAAAAALIFLTGCTDSDPSGTSEKSVAELTPLELGNLVGVDKEFATIAAQVPGFGGIYVRNGFVHVVVKDTTVSTAPSSAIFAFLQMRPSIATAAIRQIKGDFGFLELLAYKRLVNDDPMIASIDIDEFANRLKIGVIGLEEVEQVRRRAVAAGVPRNALIVEQTLPVRRLATLRDLVRPIRAGIQIETSTAQCTLGFNARQANGNRVFVTNSHCSTSMWASDGTGIYQNEGPWAIIAAELSDPAGFTGGSCPVGKTCRYSDALLADNNLGASNIYYSIAKSKNPGTTGPAGSVTIDYNRPVAGTSAPVYGLTVMKTGRTSGTTSGETIGTCVDVNVYGTSLTILCQGRVVAYSDDGDSGSPVWVDNGSDATLFGVLWGGSGGIFTFSPFSNIVDDLGSLTVTPP